MLQTVATNNPIPNILIIKDDGEVSLFDDRFYSIWKIHQGLGDFKPTNATWNHLYLISDEVIKVDEIDKEVFIFKSSNGLITCLAGRGIGRVKTPGSYHKIIASTNKDLICSICAQFPAACSKHRYNNKVPGAAIPQSLIEYFVEKQGKVDSVIVEYYQLNVKGRPTKEEDVDNLVDDYFKLDSSDCIIWKEIEKKMYTSEDFKIGCHRAFRYASPKYLTDPSLDKDFERWFNRTYPQ